ncbi:DUF6527 family protein [Ulvibacterium sp.]|uniref:DUF6527 family protein n=1 Tax=Ulvibacterium sp. TaxID=2665914 RepID=UPI00345CC8DC
MKHWSKIARRILSHFPWNRYRVRFSDDIPDNSVRRIIYVIGSKGNQWLLYFRCPCGCKKEIYLNLMQEESPRWQFLLRRNKINIAPSIHRLKGCKSHFWIVKGRVVWCS